MPKNKQIKSQEKTLEENLKEPTYVSYNILLKLEEIKRINLAILEILNAFYQPVINEEKTKEEREGTFKNK